MSVRVWHPVLPWRTRPAVWLTIPAAVAAGVFAARFVDRSSVQGYWPAVVGASATFLLFSCTLAGTAAAIEASRMRRSRFDQTPAGRSAPRILLLLLTPCFLAGALVQVAALAGLSLGTWGAPGRPPALMLIAFAAILAVHTALGYAVGRALPLPAAIPVAVVASFVWLGFTGSTSYFPIRWIAGYALNGCCDVAYQPIPAAAVAAIVFSAPAAVALLYAARPRSGRPSIPAAVRTGAVAAGVLVGALVVGLTIAPSMSAGGQPRPASETRCVESQPRICLFPEQLAGSGDPVRTLSRASRNLARAGLRPPAVLTAAVHPPAGERSLVVQVDESRAWLIHSLVASSLPDPSTGSDCSEDRATASYAVSATAEHWLADIASAGLVPAGTVPTTAGDLGRADATRLAALPERRQLAWFHHNIAAISNCTTPLMAIPDR